MSESLNNSNRPVTSSSPDVGLNRRSSKMVSQTKVTPALSLINFDRLLDPAHIKPPPKPPPPKRKTRKIPPITPPDTAREEKRRADAEAGKLKLLDGYKLVLSASIDSGNYDGVLSEEMAFFSNMSFLSAADNNFLFEDLSVFQGLRRLKLSCNGIRKIPDLSFSYHLLECLDLSYNKLNVESLESLSRLPKLYHLDLSFNDIKSLPHFDSEAFPSLNTLVLENNKLNRDSIIPLSTLNQLNLGSNEISSFPYTDGFHELQFLSLANNYFSNEKDLETLWSLPSLQTCLIWGNPIRKKHLEIQNRISFQVTPPIQETKVAMKFNSSKMIKIEEGLPKVPAVVAERPNTEKQGTPEKPKRRPKAMQEDSTKFFLTQEGLQFEHEDKLPTDSEGSDIEEYDALFESDSDDEPEARAPPVLSAINALKFALNYSTTFNDNFFTFASSLSPEAKERLKERRMIKLGPNRPHIVQPISQMNSGKKTAPILPEVLGSPKTKGPPTQHSKLMMIASEAFCNPPVQTDKNNTL
ncbi:X-ray radiation resistance-associated protein 1-like [Planoprotostelium fungivorum]|uniref:X-ray radiation resistance-associated protein 1-like n=1 Tax=Planoprotostelium fungivorum TaxID=1890364 RepID=A0A2P6N0R3_9EUKA|nr:X-ray radiation resistance-associated protein 1-like [Planoprotostelium fungivorum]